jgi:hypothetical protein
MTVCLASFVTGGYETQLTESEIASTGVIQTATKSTTLEHILTADLYKEE